MCVCVCVRVRVCVCIRWRGDYGTQIQMWFPSNFVEEIETADDSSSSNRLGKIEKGSVELPGATVGKCIVKMVLWKRMIIPKNSL